MKNTLALLSNVGIIAVKTGMFDIANTIYGAVRDMQPNNAAGNIGLASVALAGGKIEKAIDYLEPQAFSDDENAGEAEKLLLIAVMLSGDKEKAGEIHHSLMTKSSQPQEKSRHDEAEQFFT